MKRLFRHIRAMYRMDSTDRFMFNLRFMSLRHHAIKDLIQ